jgi:predicted extracellular nuclease
MKSATPIWISLLALLSFALNLKSQTLVPIYDIQGDGMDSPYEDSSVATYGIVTDTFNGLRGFFLQDPMGDGNIRTSDGIFVYEGSAPSVVPSDSVYVTGEVDEFFGFTELVNVNVSILGSSPIPAPTDLMLPSDTFPLHHERMEGMLVRLPGTHAVTDNYNLGRFGEVSLVKGEPLMIPTDSLDPNDSPPSGTSWMGFSNVVEVRNKILSLPNQYVILDDGVSGSNPSPIPFVDPVDSTLRIGTTVDNLVGCLGYSFSEYRFYRNADPGFNYAARPAVPTKPNTPQSARIVAFNIENYFTTLGSRGAGNTNEFKRQTDKLVAALKEMDADVFALMEFENNGSEAADSLVAALNRAIPNSADHYTHILSQNPDTSRVIQVGFLYKPSRITPLASPEDDTASIWETEPLAQRFEFSPSGYRFGLVAVHYSYKGCSGATGGNQDQDDGQGCFNQLRIRQSQRLHQWFQELDGSVSDGWIALGDFNAYTQEDPMDMLRDSGILVVDAMGHSYAFDGQLGSLDHAVVTSAGLLSLIQQAAIWDINATEPRVVDYTTGSKGQDLYQPNPFRSSDHNPLIMDVDMTLTGISSVSNVPARLRVMPNPTHGPFNVKWEGDAPHLLELVDMEGDAIITIEGGDLRGNSQNFNDLPAGMYFVRCSWEDGHVETVKVVVL